MGGSGTGLPVSVPGVVSGSTILVVSRDDIIRMAYEDCKGYAPDFNDLSSGQVSRASVRLNAMIKAWQAAGVGLWLYQQYTLTLTAGAQSYLLGPGTTPTAIPRPMGVVEARLVNTSGNETPLYIGSRDEYMTLPLKSSIGPASQVFYDPQLTNAVLYVWPVAEAGVTDVIKMTLKTPVQLFENLDDAPDFPDEWTDALHYNLAIRLPSALDLPDNQYSRLIGLAKLSLEDANNFDREQTPLYLTPTMGPGRM